MTNNQVPSYNNCFNVPEGRCGYIGRVKMVDTCGNDIGYKGVESEKPIDLVIQISHSDSTLKGFGSKLEIQDEELFLTNFRNNNIYLDISLLSSSGVDSLFENMTLKGTIELLPKILGDVSKNIKETVLTELLGDKKYIFNTELIEQRHINKDFLDRTYNNLIFAMNSSLPSFINRIELIKYMKRHKCYPSKYECLSKLGFSIHSMFYESDNYKFRISCDGLYGKELSFRKGDKEAKVFLDLFMSDQ